MEIERIHKLQKYSNKLKNLLSNENIDGNKLNELAALIDYSNIQSAYLCGPEEMIFNAKAALEAKGISSSNKLLINSSSSNKYFATSIPYNDDPNPS